MPDTEMDAEISPIIMGLDFFKRQLEAVTAPIGPVLVLAGPGAGKTRCLTGRIGYLVQHLGAEPSRICAITFTNKAAQEIAGRLRLGLGPTAEHLTLGTIHSLCLQILRPYAKQMDLPPGFGIADEEHQKLILRRLRIGKFRTQKLLTLFSKKKLQSLTLLPPDEELFVKYQAELRTNRMIDFDDILVLTRQLLEKDRAVLEATQNRWDHILVDELQDLDRFQYETIRLLALCHRSLFGVGDYDQSIFSWRGADPNLIARFMKDFGITRPVSLDINCRSSKAIFETARKILPVGEQYPRREIKTRHVSAFPVECVGHDNDINEARWIVEHLQNDLAASSLKRGEYAILYRTHEVGARIEETLLAAGVRCQLGRGRALTDDPVIAQLISSLRLVLDPDSELEMERLAQCVLPPALISELATLSGVSLREKLREYAAKKTGTESKKCWRLHYQMANLRALRSRCTTLTALIDEILCLGVGRYESSLEKCAQLLIDPATIPAACELAAKLRDIITRNGRLFVKPARGLEISVKWLLLKALPNLHVEHLRTDSFSKKGDAVLLLKADSAIFGEAETIALSPSDRPITLLLFKALQIAESRQYNRAFADYVAFDTETTDKDAGACEVVELAAVRVRNGEIVGQFRSLIHCTRPISPGAFDVHGYTAADLAGQPTLAEIWPKFREFIGNDLLVAHNGYKFDVPVLQRLTKSWGGLNDVMFFDSLPLARWILPNGGLRLVDLAARFGIDTGRSHHALDDAISLARVFEKLQSERLRKSRSTCLNHLIDGVALGLILEGSPTLNAEAEAIFRAGSRRALGKDSGILEVFEREAKGLGITAPSTLEIVERFGGADLQQQLRQPGSPQDWYSDAYDRLQQLIALAEGNDLDASLRKFLDTVALSKSDGAGVDPDRVALLTFHATKGLEFSRVYVVGVEDHQLPGYAAINEDREDEINEAGRLLYVAMTRAKDRLCLTYCRERRGRPSGGTTFLGEMGLIGSNDKSLADT